MSKLVKWSLPALAFAMMVGLAGIRAEAQEGAGVLSIFHPKHSTQSNRRGMVQDVFHGERLRPLVEADGSQDPESFCAIGEHIRQSILERLKRGNCHFDCAG